MVTRRNFLKSSAALSALAAMPLSLRHAVAAALGVPTPGLSDPGYQFDTVGFTRDVPDAMAPSFKYTPDRKGIFKVQIREALHDAGLVDPLGNPVLTPIFGYSDSNVRRAAPTWPGKTFEVQSGLTETVVKFQNRLEGKAHLLPVDTNLHWCYSLPGYAGKTIAANGVPTITHLHGGHSDFQYDGNPEFFSNPYEDVIGPQWGSVPGGFTTKFKYDNDVRAGNLWYHDHALGLTRLNVYAGLAGFYFVRDEFDTGDENNQLGLPCWPYEKAYAIQDRMFDVNGNLFYPSVPGDPLYADFIDENASQLMGASGNFPVAADYFLEDGTQITGYGPTALAEFFGDHMVVNGVIWPKETVEPIHYRFRLLNGTDSRFMLLQMRAVDAGSKDASSGTPIEFQVIGSDQGLATEATTVTQLMFEPGSRYDIVVDFSGLAGKRVIMTNLLGDEPFGGDFPNPKDIDAIHGGRWTDRVMAFDVNAVLTDGVLDGYDADTLATGMGASAAKYGVVPDISTTTRKVALFEGMDEYGRLQPLLGAEVNGEFKAIPWHMPTTENPANNTTEIWEIYNFTGDAHPVHLHLVHFEILGRKLISWKDGPDQVIMQHNGASGTAPGVTNVTTLESVFMTAADGFVENAPKDMVVALPGQVTRVKAYFDKPGRYVWHCHILSHEDHEMMRVMHVGPGA